MYSKCKAGPHPLREMTVPTFGHTGGAGRVRSKTAGGNRVRSGCLEQQIQVASVPPVAVQ